MERICCIEDGKEYQILIENALRGYEVVFCSTLAEAKETLKKQAQHFDMILLDVSLPDGNGIRFFSEARLQPEISELPVFVVTTDGDVMSKVTAFGLGVDDYIVKPFEALELRARVSAKFKQIRERQSSESRIQFGDLTIDFNRMQVHIAGSPRSPELTPIEFKIISLLIRQPGFVCTRTQIIDQVWGGDAQITDRTVDAHISHLRKKILDSSVEISTVPGAGYRVSLKQMT